MFGLKKVRGALTKRKFKIFSKCSFTELIRLNACAIKTILSLSIYWAITKTLLTTFVGHDNENEKEKFT